MIGMLMALVLGSMHPAFDHYAAGEFDVALEQFEASLVQDTGALGPLLYNLGNCAYRLDRLAEAALYYRRASLRMPADEQIEFNLGLTERRLGLELTRADSTLERLRDWGDRLSLGQLLVAAGVLQSLGILGLAWARRRSLWRVIFFMSLLLGVAAGARYLQRSWFAATPAGVVLVTRAPVRSEPHLDLPIIAELPAGECIRILEQSDRWMRVERAKLEGWVERSDVGLVD